MTTTLRPYQADLLAAVSDGWRAGHRRMLAQLPTGGGKGRILAAAARAVAQRGKRITLMAHRAELCDQISANLCDDGVDHGRCMTGWPTTAHAVQVAMVQSLARRVDRYAPPDLLLVDEAHHSPAGTYRGITSTWPSARLLGVTATPCRTDGRGLDEDFDAIVCGPGVRELIDAGHLADYDYYLPSPDFSMHEARIERGEYRPADALRIVSEAKIVGDAVQHYRDHIGGRPAIAFCIGVQHCQDTAAEFCAAGYRSTHVDGAMPLYERAAALRALAGGDLDVLTAADVISEGVDVPQVAGAILLRPTASTGLYLQQVGRALRPKPDGSRAVILDHVGNARRHGMPADPRRWTLDAGPRKPAAPALRECERCFRAFPAPEALATAQAECSLDPCPIQAPEPVAPAKPITAAPGELARVSDPWAWALGCDPTRAAGAELQALIHRADTEERLHMIARARGYKRGWTAHVMRARALAASEVRAA